MFKQTQHLYERDSQIYIHKITEINFENKFCVNNIVWWMDGKVFDSAERN